MRILVTLLTLISLSFYQPPLSHAARQDFNFLIMDLPIGWDVKEKNDTDFTVKNEDGTAFFTYKISPVYSLDIKEYSEAIMRAYGGYSLKLLRPGVYAFNSISNGLPAETTIQFCKKELSCIQTAIGESDDFTELFDAGRLK